MLFYKILGKRYDILEKYKVYEFYEILGIRYRNVIGIRYRNVLMFSEVFS